MRKILCFCLALIVSLGMLSVIRVDVSAQEDEAAYWKSYSTDYYYDRLPEFEKEIYKRIDEKLEEVLLNEEDLDEVVIDLSPMKIDPIEENNVTILRIYYLVLAENPQYFYVGGEYMAASDLIIDGKKCYGALISPIMPDFRKGADRAKARAEVKTMLESYTDQIPSDALPEEKEKMIHDMMCDRIVYDNYVLPSGTNTSNTIYSSLKGKTVCIGYALLFEALAIKSGLECIVSGCSAHAWNLVNLYGNWYCVDVTDDDCFVPTGYVSYNRDHGPEPDNYYLRYRPSLIYDALEEDSDYTPRYIHKGSDTFFIVNDLDNEYGRFCKCINSDNSSLKWVAYNGKAYRVENYLDSGSKKDFADFVERLYVVGLCRDSEKSGKDYWCEHVNNGNLTGADCARFFLTCEEFKGKTLDDADFIKLLYRVFFDREALEDPEGSKFWTESLKTVSRETVIEGFINSPEWMDLCNAYCVRSGSNIKKEVASDNAIAFATRLYTECLGREPEEAGLKYWSLGLTNQELTGTQAAQEFFYSDEFLGLNIDDKEYVTRLYKTFMGRDPEEDGFNYWMDKLSVGTTRDEIFDFFSTCQEFTKICEDYSIIR